MWILSLQLWEESCVGGIPCGRNPVWEESHVGGILCGRNPMWEESSVGGIPCGRNPVWEESCVGGILCGRNPMWEESCVGGIPCGRNPMWEESHVGGILCGRNSVWEESCVGGIPWEESRVGGILCGRNPMGGIPFGRNPGGVPWLPCIIDDFSFYFNQISMNFIFGFHNIGCPTKHDSWWIIFNVFSHDTVLVIEDLLQFISLNKSFTQIYYFEVNFTIILLPYSISYHRLWHQTTLQIMEEDILNYSPTVMFIGTPCIIIN